MGSNPKSISTIIYHVHHATKNGRVLYVAPKKTCLLISPFYLAPDLKGATSLSYHDSLGGYPAFRLAEVEEEDEEEEAAFRKPVTPDPMPEVPDMPGDIRSARRGRSRENNEPDERGSSLYEMK